MDWDELDETGRTWRVRVRLADHPGELATLATRPADQGCNLLGVTVLPIAADPSAPAGNVVDELVLRADSVTPLTRDAGTGGGEPGAIRLDSSGHRATITMRAGEQVVAERAWAPFTDGELARVPALLVMLGFADLRSRAQGPEGADPAPRASPPTKPSPARTRRQLSSLDAQFLNAETATTLTHVGGVTILDPAGAPGGQLTIDGLRALVGGRLHLVAPLRWRLHPVPLGLDLPYWVDAGTVELAHHIREVHLPAPGTDEQLGAQIARLAETALRRDKPLWECYLVHGLAGGRQALYTKVHHAMIDGVSAAEVLAVVLDLDRAPRAVPPLEAEVRAECAPGTVEMLQRGARRTATLPWQLLRSAPAMLPHLLDLPGASSAPGAGLLGALASGLATLAGRPLTPELPQRLPAAPMTPFNGPITAQRDFAFTDLPLDEVKAVKNVLGFTVNDVVMALCTSALRRWLIDHDALPEGPLVASVPVSVRTPEQIGTAGNQISFMLTALPTEVADPTHRLEHLHHSLAGAKKRFQATPARLLHEFSAALPQAMHGLASRTVLRAATMGGPPFNLFVSNVAGPQVPLYAAGARVTGNYPVSVVSDVGGGINITVMSYDGHLDFGIVVCSDMVPDVWDIARHLRDALTELTALVEAGTLAADVTSEVEMPDSAHGRPQPLRPVQSVQRTLVS